MRYEVKNSMRSFEVKKSSSFRKENDISLRWRTDDCICIRKLCSKRQGISKTLRMEGLKNIPEYCNQIFETVLVSSLHFVRPN